MRIIQGKLKGKDVVLEPGMEPRQAEVVDLMERLRRSLEQSAPGKVAAKRAVKARATGTARKPSAKKRRAA